MPSIYFKIMPREWLFDEKLNALGLEYKGAWANLLAVVKIAGDNGRFIDALNDPYTDIEIIKKAKISAIHFNKFIVADMILKYSNNGVIEYSIKNWLKYQPEYDRTKIYRNSLNQLNKEKESSKEKEITINKEHQTDRQRLKGATPKLVRKSLPIANNNSGVEMLHPNTSKFSKAKVIKLNTNQ